MIRMRASTRQGAGDLDDLLLPEPEVGDQRRRVDVLLEPQHQRARLARLLREVDAGAVRDLAAHEDVVANAQVRREAEFLVDDRDATVCAPPRSRRSRPSRRRGRSLRRSARSTPDRIFISVDLPAPFSPNSVVTLPRWMSKLTPLSAWSAAIGLHDVAGGEDHLRRVRRSLDRQLHRRHQPALGLISLNAPTTVTVLPVRCARVDLGQHLRLHLVVERRAGVLVVDLVRELAELDRRRWRRAGRCR